MRRSQTIIIFAPVTCGLLLFAVSVFDLYLFKQGAITGRQAVGHEMIFLLTGMLALVVQFVAGLIWLWHRQWRLAFLSIASAIAFWILFIIAGLNGAAFLNAA